MPSKKRAQRGRWLRRSVSLGGLGLVLGAGGWAAMTWAQVVRMQVAVADGCARAEAAAHTLVDLADNLLLDPGIAGVAAEPELEDVRVARAGASEWESSSSDCAATARGPGGFRARQVELATALAEVCRAGRSGANAEARAILADFGARLGRAEVGLRTVLGELDVALGAYRAAASRFPATVVVAIAARESVPGEPPARPRSAALVPTGR